MVGDGPYLISDLDGEGQRRSFTERRYMTPAWRPWSHWDPMQGKSGGGLKGGLGRTSGIIPAHQDGHCPCSKWLHILYFWPSIHPSIHHPFKNLLTIHFQESSFPLVKGGNNSCLRELAMCRTCLGALQNIFIHSSQPPWRCCDYNYPDVWIREAQKG